MKEELIFLKNFSERLVKQIKYQLRYALPLWFVFLIFSVFPDNKYSIRLRGLFISFVLPCKAQGLRLGRDVTLLNVDNLYLGSNVYFAKSVWINAIGGVRVEDEVIVSPYTVVASSRHAFHQGSVFRGGSSIAPINIGFGTWISSHCTIAAGVNIGEGVLVGANSLVAKDIVSNKVAYGVPAVVQKDRHDRPGEVKSAR
jgi:acetyltransferase-like isoleucine patch superfamily enzyme